MPIFYQQDINEGTRLAVWKIEEPEEFFLRRVPLKRDVSHPHKRLQHLAGRFLLPYLFPDFPLEEILIADTRKPFLPDEKYHFSISHCESFAAAIVSSRQRVGIDAEVVDARIEKIGHKFMTDAEHQLLIHCRGHGGPVDGKLADRHLRQTLLWCSKESMYKWYGEGLVDFKRDMVLRDCSVGSADPGPELEFLFSKGGQISLRVKSRIFGRLVLAWITT